MNPRNLVLLIIVLMAITSEESVLARATPKKFEAVLKGVYPSDGPGATVIVTRKGKTLFRRAYGKANIELGVPMEPGSVLRLGSITKQFTASAVMALVEQGKLSLTDEITKYLPGYPVHGHVITIEHLLNHTSGIHSYTSIPGYMGNPVRSDLTTGELVDVFKELPMDFAPGDQFRYNNSGFVLLGAIIEKVSGISYDDFIRSIIFEPLGMKDSHYGGTQLIVNRASGYQGADGIYENAGHVSMTQPHGAGSLLSTVDDLLRWDSALYTNEIISQESLDRMTTRARLNSGEEIDYGYGFGIGTLRDRRMVSHGGGIHGFSSFALRLPDQQIYVAVLTNIPGLQPSPQTIAYKLAAIALDDPFPDWKRVEVPESTLSQYVGVYQTDDDIQRTVTTEEGKLYTRRAGGMTLVALPASSTRFYYENSLTWFELELDDSGQAIAILIHANGASKAERALRVASEVPTRRISEVDPTIYDDYVGVYQLRPGFKITVVRDADRILAQATGQPQFEIFPESEINFFLKVVDAQITFVRGTNGNVEELVLHQSGQDMSAPKIQ